MGINGGTGAHLDVLLSQAALEGFEVMRLMEAALRIT